MFRKKKQQMLKYGVLFVLLIVAAGCGFFLFRKYQNNRMIKQLEDSLGQSVSYRLKRDMKADEIISEADIEEDQSHTSEEVGMVPVGPEDIIGRKLRYSCQKGRQITQAMLYEENEVEGDVRVQGFEYIQFQSRLQPGDYIDVRISFANGADLVLLAKKKVVDIEEQLLWMNVTEEEILRLSSAVVDSFVNSGSKIYAIAYVSENQPEAIVNYKVNEVVEKLMKDDPNILTKAKNVAAWKAWDSYRNDNSVGEQLPSEEQQDDFFEETEREEQKSPAWPNSKEDSGDEEVSDEDAIYPEDEDITYYD
ncbi:MAG: hypothetical protein K6G65_05860 [Lachnospiraceae bacterium]|nr:hypothetical protein [Lachnospiraceae bacterium]